MQLQVWPWPTDSPRHSKSLNKAVKQNDELGSRAEMHVHACRLLGILCLFELMS